MSRRSAASEPSLMNGLSVVVRGGNGSFSAASLRMLALCWTACPFGRRNCALVMAFGAPEALLHVSPWCGVAFLFVDLCKLLAYIPLVTYRPFSESAIG